MGYTAKSDSWASGAGRPVDVGAGRTDDQAKAGVTASTRWAVTRRIGRRQFISGAGAIVAGFDLATRSWVEVAEARPAAMFADVPSLDGRLVFAIGARNAVARDQGDIISRRPAAVLEPGSVQDIAKMIGFCREHAIQVATRGQAHTTFGQGLVSGLLIDNRALRKIHSIDPDGADVDCGVLWRELTDASYRYGLTPPSVTGYTKLSVGGTLSVGGVPAITSNRAGAQVDRVQELEVVTGTGDIVTCSPSWNSDLFGAMLAGLGQCGVITRAKLDLVPARQLARTYNLTYKDPSAFFSDFRTLLGRGELDAIYNIWFPFGTNVLYQIQAVVFYDLPHLPDTAHLFRGLTVSAVEAIFRDLPYLTYMSLVDDVYDTYAAGLWFDSLIKPWFDVWLPDSSIEQFVTTVAPKLTLEDVGPTGFILLLPQLRSSMTRPLLRLPDVPGDEFVYLFDILTSATLPGPNSTFVTKMLARNRKLYDAAHALGGVRYPIGSIEFSPSDWAAHYGDAWPQFQALKHRYDPDSVLTPGPGIFAPPPPSTGPGPPGVVGATVQGLIGHGGLLGPEGLLQP
jgi:FAD/FMN-containing dehydrogenase